MLPCGLICGSMQPWLAVYGIGVAGQGVSLWIIMGGTTACLRLGLDLLLCPSTSISAIPPCRCARTVRKIKTFFFKCCTYKVTKNVPQSSIDPCYLKDTLTNAKQSLMHVCLLLTKTYLLCIYNVLQFHPFCAKLCVMNIINSPWRHLKWLLQPLAVLRARLTDREQPSPSSPENVASAQISSPGARRRPSRAW